MQHHKDKRAFTIVELLISLAITAMLLAAVAVAFNASVKNYQENEGMFKAMNSARQALLRMTTQLRTANVVNIDSLTTECTLTIATGQITYRYNSGDKKLYLITPGGNYVLCDNVTAISFTKALTTDGTKVKSVQISMTVGIGNNSQTVSSAAVIRKNL